VSGSHFAQICFAFFVFAMTLSHDILLAKIDLALLKSTAKTLPAEQWSFILHFMENAILEGIQKRQEAHDQHWAFMRAQCFSDEEDEQ